MHLRWRAGAELRHLPRLLPAHRRRLEVHRARLRDQIRRHHATGRLSAQRGRGGRWPAGRDHAGGRM